VIISNLGPILHRFGDTVVYWSKIAKVASSCPPQSQKLAWLGVTLSNFLTSQIFPETRMIRLSDGEEIMTIAFFVLRQYRSVTDRRTDRRKDGHSFSGYTSACIACYANALVKMELHHNLQWRITYMFSKS